jgi:glycosidase
MLNKLIFIPFLYLIATSCHPKNMDSVLYPVETLIIDQGSIHGYNLDVYKKSSDQDLELVNTDGNNVWLMDNDSLIFDATDVKPGLYIVLIKVNGLKQSLVIRVEPLIPHTFSYHPDSLSTSNEFVVMGGFNDWSRTALKLQDQNEDGIYERTVFLKPERHEYKFVINGEEIIDPENSIFISNNIGGWNSILDLSPQKKRESGYIVKTTQHNGRLRFQYYPPDDGALLDKVYILFNNVIDTNNWNTADSFNEYEIEFRNDFNGLVRIIATDTKDRVLLENHTIIRDGIPLNVRDHQDDWYFTVLYNIMVDRFLDGNPDNTKQVPDTNLHPLSNFHGGDLSGILNKLEDGYFTDLGVSSMWISPLYTQPEGGFKEWIPPNRHFTGYHGYWPVQPRMIDTRFGTDERLQQVVKTAHDQNIKVILDLVTNHVHENHLYFKNNRHWFGTVELPNGEKNIRLWGEETRLTTWFDIFIPSFNFSNAPAAAEQIVKDAIWWMKEYDLDGFRQDAVKHVPHTFWKLLTRSIKDEYPDQEIFQIGETFGSDRLIKSYVNPGELASQFNFSIYFNARGPFSSDTPDFKYLTQVIKNNLSAYGPLNKMGNITSSHDQVRFTGIADGQVSLSEDIKERAFNDPPTSIMNESTYKKLSNFHAFNLVLPGIPVIYYGEEIGLMGAGDPDNRRISSLALGDLKVEYAQGSVLIISKHYFNESIFFAVNNSAETVEYTLSSTTLNGTGFEELITGEKLNLKNNSVRLSLKPFSHYFYLIKN